MRTGPGTFYSNPASLFMIAYFGDLFAACKNFLVSLWTGPDVDIGPAADVKSAHLTILGNHLQRVLFNCLDILSLPSHRLHVRDELLGGASKEEGIP